MKERRGEKASLTGSKRRGRTTLTLSPMQGRRPDEAPGPLNMPDNPELMPNCEEFARRSAERLEKADPVVGRVARFDPIWIALFIEIVKLLIVLFKAKNVPMEAAQLRAPRWWQVVAWARRRRLLAVAQRHIRKLRGTSLYLRDARTHDPDQLARASVDAVLEEASASEQATLELLFKELDS